MAGVLARHDGGVDRAACGAGYPSLALHALRPSLDWYDTVSYTVRCRQSLAHCEQTKETRHMSTRVTFAAAIAYAWAMIEDDESGEEVRKIVSTSGTTPVDAANSLVEHYNLDPATEVRCVMVNFDAPDPIAMGAVEAHIADSDAAVTVATSKPE